MQARMNQEAIDMLPRIKHVIALAEDFEACQMTQATLMSICNSVRSISEMSGAQIFIFEEMLLEQFKYKEWINRPKRR
jgi:hypothetical protein